MTPPPGLPPSVELATARDGPVAPPPLPRPGVPAPRTAPLPLGEVTRRHLARVLEQSQGALLLACVEAAGGDPAARWRLVVTAAALEPETGPPPAPG